MYHETSNHSVNGTATKSSVTTRPARNDSLRSLPTRSARPSATVTMPTTANAARVGFSGLPARVCQISACTMRSTFSSARVARNNANPATTKETIRSVVERSPTLAIALAASPPMPASRASVPGLVSAALAPTPNTHTSTNM